MNWVALIQLVIEIIAEKRDNRSAQDIHGSLRNPGRHEWRVCRRTIRNKLGLRGRELRLATNEAMHKLETASDHQLNACAKVRDDARRQQADQIGVARKPRIHAVEGAR